MEKEGLVAKSAFVVIQSTEMQNSAGLFQNPMKFRMLWWPSSFFFLWEGWKVTSMTNRNVCHRKDSKSSPFLDKLNISLSVPHNPFTFLIFMWCLLTEHKYGMLNLCVSQAIYSPEGSGKIKQGSRQTSRNNTALTNTWSIYRTCKEQRKCSISSTYNFYQCFRNTSALPCCSSKERDHG